MGLKRYILASFFCIISVSAFAQKWEIGAFAGASGYMGDLNPINPFNARNFAYGGSIKHNFDANWSLKLNAQHGKIYGADAFLNSEQYYRRNLSFFSPITEVSFQLEFNFFEYIASVSKRRYSPYLFTGVGGVLFNPQTKYNGDTYELYLYGTEGQDVAKPYKRYALSVPYGVGLKYNITGAWSLIGEVGYRTAYTDYVDDVSGYYPDKSKLYNTTAIALSDRTGEYTGVYTGSPGTQRGDMRKHDTYMFTGISLTFTFISQKCPVIQ